MKAAAPKAKRPVRVEDDYLDLVRRFPLRPLKTRVEHAMAQRILDRMIGRDDLTPGQRDYAEALVRFVHEYERQESSRQLAKLSPLEILKHLLAENDMSTTDLGDIVGSRGLASEVLNGQRGLSKRLIARIAERFRVDPAMFLERADRC